MGVKELARERKCPHEIDTVIEENEGRLVCWLCGKEIKSDEARTVDQAMIDHHKQEHPESWERFVKALKIITVKVGENDGTL